VKGGFLSVTASRESIALRLHHVHGDVVHKHTQA
jgi:hypothetical protein